MAWTALKAAVAEVIKTNGNQEITGAILQSVLLSIIDNVGLINGYKGIATTETVPGTPDGKEFYIASQPGNYVNFGINIESPGFYILKSESGIWSFDVLQNDSFKNESFTNNMNTVSEQIFNSEPIILGSDLLLTSTFTDGYLKYDGKLQLNTEFDHSDYIDISNYKLLYLYLITYSGCFYDENHKYLMGIGNIYSHITDKNTIISVPKGAKYIRLNRNKSRSNEFFIKNVEETKLTSTNLFPNQSTQLYLNALKKSINSMVINATLIGDVKNGYLGTNGIDIIKNINYDITDFIEVDIERKYFIVMPTNFTITPAFGYDETHNVVNGGVEVKDIGNIKQLVFKNSVKYAKFNIVSNCPNYLFEGIYYPEITNKSTVKSFYQSIIPIEKSLTFGVSNQNGYINEGSISASTELKVTDFIKIKPNKILAINVSDSLWIIGCLFDKSKTFIKTIRVDDLKLAITDNEAKFLIPDNAEYIRLNIADKYGCFAAYDSIFLNRQNISINSIEGINVIDPLNLAENLTYKRGYYLNELGNEIFFPQFKYGLEYIEIEASTEYTKYPNAEVGGVWYDVNKNPIGILASSNYYNQVTFTSPSNAAFVRIGFQPEFDGLFYKGKSKRKILIPDLELPGILNNYWKGKKIVWFGTSIPAGYPHDNDQENYAYPNKIASMLGADILNYCVPNGVIRSAKSDGSSMGGRDVLSFTNLSSGINYQNHMLDLIGTNDEPDLFVFDYSVNDMDADATDINNISGYDFMSEDTNTFLGAYNFVLKQLFTAKKRARILILTHYSDDGISGGSLSGKNAWKTVNDLIIQIADYWNIPVCKVRDKTGWNYTHGIENLSTFNPDGIHPATDPTGQAVEILTQITSREILMLA